MRFPRAKRSKDVGRAAQALGRTGRSMEPRQAVRSGGVRGAVGFRRAAPELDVRVGRREEDRERVRVEQEGHLAPRQAGRERVAVRGPAAVNERRPAQAERQRAAQQRHAWHDGRRRAIACRRQGAVDQRGEQRRGQRGADLPGVRRHHGGRRARPARATSAAAGRIRAAEGLRLDGP